MYNSRKTLHYFCKIQGDCNAAIEYSLHRPTFRLMMHRDGTDAEDNLTAYPLFD